MDMNDADKDAIIRTVMGEAGDQPEAGKAAVAHVIMNRVRSGEFGSSASKVVRAPGQFEPWQTRSKELSSYNPNSKDYQSTKAIIDGVVSGQIKDPTSGATHFLAPDIMRARGKSNPDWAQGKPIAQIGGHAFYAPNGSVAPDLLGSLVKSYDAPPAAVATDAEDHLSNLVKSYDVPTKTNSGLTRVIITKNGDKPKDDPYANITSDNPVYPALAHTAAGFGKGVMDVVNTGSQGIGSLTNHVTQFLADRGIMSPSDTTNAKGRSDVLNERVDTENKNFDAAHGDSWAASGGRVAGQIAATAPLLMTGEGAVGAGVNALTRASPTIARMAFTLGDSTLARLGLIAPAQGALAGTEIAGSTSAASNEPVGQQMLHGAETGTILGPVGPAVMGAGRYLGGAAKSIVSPFTEAGQNRLANGFLHGQGGNALNINAREIVPGSVPTLAEATGDANIAGIQRSMRDLPGNRNFVAREEANSQARSDHIARVMGTPQDVEAAKASLDTQANHAVSTIFKPGQKVDAAPVVAEIDSILSGAGGKRDAVKTVLGNIRSKIIDEKTGAIQSDPEYLYQTARKQIGDLLDKNADSKAGQQAARELMQVRDVLDDRITKAVPGFDKYLADYSSAAKPIDAAKYLQGLRLTDAQGNITLAKVQGALQSIAKNRQAAGINPTKSLTQDHINALTDIRDDLLRAANVGKGRSVGSNSVQNIASQALLGGVMGNKLGGLVGHVNPALLGSGVGGAIGSVAGPAGAAIGAGAGTVLGHLAGDAFKGKNALVQHQLEDILLNPHKFVPSPQRGQNLSVNRLKLLAPAVAAERRNALAAPARN